MQFVIVVFHDHTHLLLESMMICQENHEHVILITISVQTKTKSIIIETQMFIDQRNERFLRFLIRLIALKLSYGLFHEKLFTISKMLGLMRDDLLVHRIAVLSPRIPRMYFLQNETNFPASNIQVYSHAGSPTWHTSSKSGY